MSAFENAKKFFAAVDAPKGWAGCKEYVADGATFTAQCEPLVDIKTIEEYCGWMEGFVNGVVPGATYDLHTSTYDEDSRTAMFFATFHGKHTADGGPVPPTNKEAHTDYVYVFTMDENDKVKHFVKIWNAPWAINQLGWT